MFPKRFFNLRMFCSRFWAKIGGPIIAGIEQEASNQRCHFSAVVQVCDADAKDYRTHYQAEED